MDLAPSAYDMIVASLPPSPSGQERYASDAERLAQLPTPAAVKSAWQRSKQATASSSTPRAQGKQTQKRSPLPNESFVLLQDSVIRNIPSQGPALVKPQKTLSSRSREDIQTQAASPDHPNPSPLSHH